MAIENKKYTENKKRKKYVLTFEDLQYIIPAFRSKSGALLLKILYSLAGINKINDLYSHSCDKNGAEFVDSILKELGITYNIHHKEVLDQLPKGGFVTVSKIGTPAASLRKSSSRIGRSTLTKYSFSCP